MTSTNLPFLTLKALPPAKLNLRLKVTGRRDDDYHLLSMLVVPINLRDEIVIDFYKESNTGVPVSLKVDINSQSKDPGLSDIRNNLVFRAATSFIEHFRPQFAVDMRLAKHIPSGAGLGGGSSDGAYTLRLLAQACEKISGRPFVEENQAQLRKMAGDLGSDAPFFLQDSPAIVRGVGEQITPISFASLSQKDVLLVLPSILSETRQAYADFMSAHPILSAERKDLLLEELQRLHVLGSNFREVPSTDGKFFEHLIENDFEPIVVARFPLIGQILDRLRAVPMAVAGLTGSGSACFIVSNGPNELEIGEISDAIKKLDSAIIVTRIRILAV